MTFTMYLMNFLVPFQGRKYPFTNDESYSWAVGSLTNLPQWLQSLKLDQKSTWNPKQPFRNGCFNWMLCNLYLGNGWKSPNIHLKMVVGSSRQIEFPMAAISNFESTFPLPFFWQPKCGWDRRPNFHMSKNYPRHQKTPMFSRNGCFQKWMRLLLVCDLVIFFLFLRSQGCGSCIP